MPTAAFYTLGCKLNQYETEAIREQFEEHGYDVVPFSEVADVYIINTCAVTAKSDRSSRQAVYQAVRRAPEARIVATGCSVEISPEPFAQIPGVDFVLGNTGKGLIFNALSEGKRFKTDQNIFPQHGLKDGHPWLDISRFRNYSRAFLKIQDGCDARCSYCVVPFARGVSRSRPLQSILSQARRLIASGYKEIVLTGVHVGAYGLDLSERISLVDVLRALITIDDLWRIRLSSIEPMECSPQLIDLIASTPKICRHLHIPLQSGDDTILQRMGRNYGTKNFAKIVENVITQIPDVGIGTDIMVGFPEETDFQFQQSFRFVKDLPFSYLHIFSYSKRPGTAAAEFRGHVSKEVKRNRSKIFRELRSEKITRFRQRFVGQSLDVLLEYRRDRQTGMLTGLSDNYIRVHVEGRDRLQGAPVKVDIEKVTDDRTYGSVTGMI